MRRTMLFLLLAAAAAAPLAAQDRGPDRNGRGRDGRPEAPRAEDRGPSGRPDGGDRWNGRGSDDDRGRDRGSDRGREDRGPGGQGDRPGGVRPPDGRGPRPGEGWSGDRDWRSDRGRRGDDRGPRAGWNGAGQARGDWNRRGPDRDWGLRRDDGRRNDRGDRDRWRDDRRYDWQAYRARNNSLYRLPRYYGPRGDGYNRWSRGYRVQPAFYGQNYWIADPWRYRLPPAYGDRRWVRYHDDVALIDVRSGVIEDIIYSFFWR